MVTNPKIKRRSGGSQQATAELEDRSWAGAVAAAEQSLAEAFVAGVICVCWRSSRLATVSLFVARRPISVAAGRVETGGASAGESVLSASGYVVAHHKIAVGAKVMGRVAWIGVEKGDRVQEGQVLVRLEDSEFRAQVNQAKANLAAAQARLDQFAHRFATRREIERQSRSATSRSKSEECRS